MEKNTPVLFLKDTKKTGLILDHDGNAISAYEAEFFMKGVIFQLPEADAGFYIKNGDAVEVANGDMAGYKADLVSALQIFQREIKNEIKDAIAKNDEKYFMFTKNREKLRRSITGMLTCKDFTDREREFLTGLLNKNSSQK